MRGYVDEHESVRQCVNGVNVLMYSRNIACIDGHDSGIFFLLDIMCDCRKQSWNRNPKLNIAVVDLKSKIENQNLIY